MRQPHSETRDGSVVGLEEETADEVRHETPKPSNNSGLAEALDSRAPDFPDTIVKPKREPPSLAHRSGRAFKESYGLALRAERDDTGGYEAPTQAEIAEELARRPADPNRAAPMPTLLVPEPRPEQPPQPPPIAQSLTERIGSTRMEIEEWKMRIAAFQEPYDKLVREAFTFQAAYGLLQQQYIEAELGLSGSAITRDVDALRARMAEVTRNTPSVVADMTKNAEDLRLLVRDWNHAKSMQTTAHLRLDKLEKHAAQIEEELTKAASRYKFDLDGKLSDASMEAVARTLRPRRYLPMYLDGGYGSAPDPEYLYEQRHVVVLGDATFGEVCTDDEEALAAIAQHVRKRGSLRHLRMCANELASGARFGPEPLRTRAVR